MMDKLKMLVLKLLLPKKLEGYKTVIGLAGLCVCIVMSAMGHDIPKEVYMALTALCGVGLADKGRRAEQATKEFKALLEDLLKEKK